MAAILLSSTEFMQQLEEVGMPRAQAEVVAKGLAAMYVHNFDALVTKDYLDTRFGEFEARLGRDMDQRFAEVDRRFMVFGRDMDQRFTEIDQRFTEIDHRFKAMESLIEQRFAGLEAQTEQRHVGLETQTEQRYAGLEAQTEQRYAGLEARMQLGFAEVETRFARVNVMLAIILAALAVPVLQTLLTWTAP